MGFSTPTDRTLSFEPSIVQIARHRLPRPQNSTQLQIDSAIISVHGRAPLGVSFTVSRLSVVSSTSDLGPIDPRRWPAPRQRASSRDRPQSRGSYAHSAAQLTSEGSAQSSPGVGRRQLCSYRALSATIPASVFEIFSLLSFSFPPKKADVVVLLSAGVRGELESETQYPL